MPRISFAVVEKMLYQTKAYLDFWDGTKIKQQNRLKRSSGIWLLIYPVTYSGSIPWYSGLLFHSFCILLLTFDNCINRKGWQCFYVPFLRDDIREQKKYEMRTQTSVDNTVNDLRYEIKSENCVKDKNNFSINQNIAFLSWTEIYFILGDMFF